MYIRIGVRGGDTHRHAAHVRGAPLAAPPAGVGALEAEVHGPGGVVDGREEDEALDAGVDGLDELIEGAKVG